LEDESIVQRWLCRDCGFRFCDPEQLHVHKRMFRITERRLAKPLKAYAWRSNRQIGATETKGAKNLDPEQTSVQEVPEKREDIRGRLVQHAWTMKQEGYAAETIRMNGSCLRALMARGANLADPTSVKDALAREQKWSQSRKRNAINAYTLFLKFNGMTWTKPKC
jgi:hypothetical protein